MLIPTDGVWTFFTNSDDGSKLFIGNTEVVSNDGLHPMTERSGEIGMRAGRHALRVEFFERTGGAGLTASWSGPGVAKQTIPAANLWRGGATVPADYDGNGRVDAIDLATLLAAWGTVNGTIDLSGDGLVNAV
ncbi:MAG: PA14 domain-containing protein, partial [Planctomycetota bacterium]